MKHNQKLSFATLWKGFLNCRCVHGIIPCLSADPWKNSIVSQLWWHTSMSSYKVRVDLCVLRTRLFWSWTNLSNYFPIALYMGLNRKVDLKKKKKSKLEIAVHSSDTTSFSLVPMLFSMWSWGWSRKAASSTAQLHCPVGGLRTGWWMNGALLSVVKFFRGVHDQLSPSLTSVVCHEEMCCMCSWT